MNSKAQPPISMLSMDDSDFDLDKVDVEMRPAVKLLRDAGFDTFTSCSGGSGHCFERPTVRFNTDDLEVDLIRVDDVLDAAGHKLYYIKPYYYGKQLKFVEVEWWSLKLYLNTIKAE